MKLTEQIFRSRQLMCESTDDKLDLISEILNDLLSFNDNIQYNCVEEFNSDDVLYFSVEVTMDSSMYHKVSPNFNPEYREFLDNIDEHISNVVNQHLPENYSYDLSVFFHKNVDVVIEYTRPKLDEAFKVYSKNNSLPNLPYKFFTNSYRREIVIFIDYGVETGSRFVHRYLMDVLTSLYGDKFDDFYITAIGSSLLRGDNFSKVYESISNENVICDTCGWSWELSDGGDDPYTCHKCGHDNLPS
jgi:hypothetical protein